MTPKTAEPANVSPLDARHLMIDIETWDTRPTAVIRAIALAAFEPAGADVPYTARLIDCRLAVDAQIQAGRTLGADTVRWWVAHQAAPLLASIARCILQARKADKTKAAHEPTNLKETA